MNTELQKGIYWVGINDWEIRKFHGHELSVHFGTTYNSYLIIDEKIALIDSVLDNFTHDFFRKIEKIIPLSSIDYVIVNHSEPDHSGALPEIMRVATNATMVVSKGGAISVNRHYPNSWKTQIVKTNDSISLGKNSLRFFEVQMLHWPDSMMTYCPEAKMLFSNDAFGQHYASSSLFADEACEAEVWREALKYYANILTPFSKQVRGKIQEFLSFEWPVEMICPSHGVLWRKNPSAIVEKYLEWASGKSEPTIVIAYDSMWKGTARMAHAIAMGLETEKVPYKIFYLPLTDRNDLITEIFKAGAVIIGSPTFNRGVIPSAMEILEDIRGLKFQNKIGAAFGTYGWSGESIKRIEEFLEAGGVKIVQPGIRVLYSPHPEDLEECEKFGRTFATNLKSLQNAEKELLKQ